MKFPEWLSVFGDTNYRGDCPQESAEQVTFFARLRREYPDSLGLIALHPKNEGARSGKAFGVLSMDKALGMAPGAADIIIPASVAFVCEMKRRDHTKSSWQPKQIDYLLASDRQGAFVCVALGVDGAWEALQKWLDLQS